MEATVARMIDWPYLDPDSCLDDPDRKGWKLCSRCSKAGEICCNITPEPLSTHHLGSAFMQAHILQRQDQGLFPQAEDYRIYKWVCEGWCDKNGLHRDFEQNKPRNRGSELLR